MPGSNRPTLPGAALALSATFVFVAGVLAVPSVPTRTTEDWLAWREAQIARILEPGDGGAINRAQVALRCEEAYREVAPYAEADPQLKQTLGNFFSFIAAQRLGALPGRALALQVSDRDYWRAAQSHLRLPALLASQPFLEAMARPQTYGEAAQMIERYNASLPEERKWRVAFFRGRFIKSVDRTTYGRMLVVVPGAPLAEGGTRDLWVSFAVATPDQDAPLESRSVSVVCVERKPGQQGNTAYLADFLRTRTGSGIALMPTAAMHDNPSKNCYDCHKTAALPVHPEQNFSLDAKGQLATTSDDSVLRSLNALVREYGPSEFPLQDAGAYGPCLGPLDRPRTDAQIRLMAGAPLGDESVKRIKSAMNCASCHAGFAPLNYPEPLFTDREQKSMRDHKGLAQTFVEEGRMPPGNKLTPEERRALWRCLSLEYFDPATKSGLLPDWLKS